MRTKYRQNQAWIFSFADLAFLLLIAFTQASTIGKNPISVGEMTLPKVVKGPDVELFVHDAKVRQIRVHRPYFDTDNKPFQLVTIARDGHPEEGPRMSAPELKGLLVSLKNEGADRPVLVPDEKSLSKDMLLAMSLIEKIWQGSRKVTVEKVEKLEEITR
ncbi:MAG: hypothetical protein B5M56_00150 [Desulfococcus sp. 4484_241]|nr:MAG: hypothetical protein B5M56_00150 [Desulfococcus sp. 4484_241]